MAAKPLFSCVVSTRRVTEGPYEKWEYAGLRSVSRLGLDFEAARDACASGLARQAGRDSQGAGDLSWSFSIMAVPCGQRKRSNVNDTKVKLER